MTKRGFTIDIESEHIQTEGHTHRNVAIKYLMRRRRSVLMTKDSQKAEKLFSELPKLIKIIGKQITKAYDINWERVGEVDYEGSRFVFNLNEIPN